MKNILTLLIFCSLSSSLLANKDSLLAVWNDETQADSARLNANHALIEYYLYEDLEIATDFSQKLLDLAIKVGDKDMEIVGYKMLASCFNYKGDTEISLDYFKKGESMALVLGKEEVAAHFSNNIGSCYYAMGKYDKAIQIYDSLNTVFQTRTDYELLASSYYALGAIYNIKNNIHKAISNFQKCEKVLQQYTIDNSLVNDPYNDLGMIYFDLNELTLATFYFDKAIAFNKNYDDNTDAYIGAILGKGNIEEKKGNFDKAIEYYQQGLKIAEKYPDFTYFKINPLIDLINYALKKNLPTAKDHINELISITKDHNLAYELAIAQKSKGEYFLIQKEYNKAKNWCQQSLELANDIQEIEAQMNSCECLYKTHKQLGNMSKALYYHELFLTHKDALFNENKIRDITKVELQYKFNNEKRQDSLKNQQQLALLEKDKQVLAAQNQNYLIGLAGIGLLSLLGFGFYFNMRRKNRQISQQKRELEQFNTTKDQLFAIISHDLRKPALAFRGISKKVKFLIKQKEFDTLDKYGVSLEKAAYSLNSLLDNLLKWALQERNMVPYRPSSINVAAETQAIVDLFDPIATNKNITFKTDIPERLTAFMDVNSYATIIRNLIDNAIKFTPSGGKITIDAQQDDTKALILKVSDNGVGIAPDKLKQLFELKKDKNTRGTDGEKGTGLGLNLVKSLVDLNKGKIKVNSQQQEGTTFKLIFPLGN